jgi:hypothetical protein
MNCLRDCKMQLIKLQLNNMYICMYVCTPVKIFLSCCWARWPDEFVQKIAWNVAKPIFVKTNAQLVGTVWNFFAIFVIFEKLPRENNRPKGESFAQSVTLLLRHSSCSGRSRGQLEFENQTLQERDFARTRLCKNETLQERDFARTRLCKNETLQERDFARTRLWPIQRKSQKKSETPLHVEMAVLSSEQMKPFAEWLMRKKNFETGFNFNPLFLDIRGPCFVLYFRHIFLFFCFRTIFFLLL